MEPNEIYRLETMEMHETDVTNLLLQNGWKVQAIQQRGNLTIDALPDVSVTVLLGASKSTFEKYPKDKAEKDLKIKRGDLF